MANAPDTLLVTGPVFQQVAGDAILVTPAGGTQDTLANLVNGGTVQKSATFSSAVVGSNTLTTLANFASIVPAGSTAAQATAITTQVAQLGTAASTTGVAFGAASSLPLGESILLLNTGSAAVHVYGGGYTIDTIAGTTGVILTNGFSCFFTATGTATLISGPRGTTSIEGIGRVIYLDDTLIDITGERSAADRAIDLIRAPRDMHIICVDVTNRCDLRCSNCTRMLVNQATHWDMTLENFRTALRSLRGYEGVIAMIGGNPCLHRQFPELCHIFVEEVANPRQRGLWSNNLFNYQQIIAETFGFYNLNPHGDEKGAASITELQELLPTLPFYRGHSTHAPIMTAVRDVVPDEEQMWDAIAKCDVNRNWSASIIENKGQLRAYFCEVAASFDLARGTDNGQPVTEGWWRAGIRDFSGQIEHFCPGCGVPARLEGRRDKDETDDYTLSNADIATKARGRRSVQHMTAPQEAAKSEAPVTSYHASHRATGVPKISVIIPCFNGAVTLEETVTSVLSQEGAFATEIIIADDGSTDGSREMAIQMAMHFPGVIKPMASGSNTGAAAARNRGLRVATGDFVCFLDADDCYTEGFFAAALRIFADDPRYGAIVTQIELVNAHREVHPLQLHAMVGSIPSNMMVRRAIADIIGGFPDDPAFRGPTAGEDVAFKQVLFQHFAVGFVHHPFLRYRVTRGSHFDRFLDSSTVQGDKLAFTQTAAVDLDGSRPAALGAYQARAMARIRVLEHCRLPVPGVG